MVRVILDSPGGLWLRTGKRSIKGMLKYKMLILQERKPVDEIRGIHWYMDWEILKDRIGKPKANHCLSEKKPTKDFLWKGKVSSWLLFEKNLQLSHSLPNRPLFLTKCCIKWLPFELRAVYWESYRMNRFFFFPIWYYLGNPISESSYLQCKSFAISFVGLWFEYNIVLMV